MNIMKKDLKEIRKNLNKKMKETRVEFAEPIIGN